MNSAQIFALLIAGTSVPAAAETPAAPPPPYTLTLTIAPSAGYDSNALQLGESLPLPDGFSRKDYGFFLIDATLDFDWKSASKKDEFELSYEYTQQFYEGLSGSDEGDHVWSPTYTHTFDDKWSANVALTDKYVTIDGHSYSNQILARPAIDYQSSVYLTTELASSFAVTENYFPISTPVRDPDSNTYTAELFEIISFKNYQSGQFKLGYLHYWNNADGSDYDYSRNRLQFNAKGRFNDIATSRWYNLKFKVKYYHSFDRYDNLNSHAGPNGFAFKRGDDRDFTDAILSFDLIKDRNHIDDLAVNVEYNYIHNSSNLALFDYDEHIVSAGCSVTFK